MAQKNRLQLAILCGGQSAEHEISVISAKNVMEAIDNDKYDMSVIFIARTGGWFLFSKPSDFLSATDPNALVNSDRCQRVSIVFGEDAGCLITLNGASQRVSCDVVFPVLHGPNGEDGTVQGLLELANIPFVGAGVLGSAVCMDKEVSKRLLRAANIPTPKWIALTGKDVSEFDFDTVKKIFGVPVFVKPANLGSSIAISKVKTQKQFEKAVNLALQYDHKIIIEEAIVGREVECSVLGNGDPKASLPGEVILHHEFYSYEAKYLDEKGVSFNLPAQLPEKTIEKIQELAVKAFKILCCEGMARVDFFISEQGKIYVNEVNTIPGFTKISLYPQNWEVSGLAYPDLIDNLIALARERALRDSELITNYDSRK